MTGTELLGAVTDRCHVSEGESQELLPSGTQSILAHRTHWARYHLYRSGYVSSPSPGTYVITARGEHLLAIGPEGLPADLARVLGLPDRSPNRSDATHDALEGRTPEEYIEYAHGQLTRAVEADLLNAILRSEPAFFEKAVVDLLVAMGYGGGRADAGRVLGRSHDEGIDGVINDDALGLDAIYVQAKRWDHPVGRPDIQQFAGAMQAKRAHKGVFITTSHFTPEALAATHAFDSRIVLIDGVSFARLMVIHGVGVTTDRSFTLKRLDVGYFGEESAL